MYNYPYFTIGKIEVYLRDFTLQDSLGSWGQAW